MVIDEAIRELAIAAAVYEKLAGAFDREDNRTHAHLVATVGDVPRDKRRTVELLQRAGECRRIISALGMLKT